jgi:hypothetical protein
MKLAKPFMLILLAAQFTSNGYCQDDDPKLTPEEIVDTFTKSSSRVCIKSYPWPWDDIRGSDGHIIGDKFNAKLKHLTSKEMGEIRERVENLTKEYTEDAVSAKQSPEALSPLGKQLLSHLEDKGDRVQLKLYGDFLHCLTLSKEGEFEQLENLLSSIRKHRAISVRNVTRSKVDLQVDQSTYLSPDTLQNLISLLDLKAKAKLAVEPKAIVGVLVQYLDSRGILMSYPDMGIFKGVDDAILDRLSDVDIDDLKKLQGVKVEKQGAGSLVSIKGREVYKLLIAGDGEVTLQ